jgi:hypothetical protein
MHGTKIRETENTNWNGFIFTFWLAAFCMHMATNATGANASATSSSQVNPYEIHPSLTNTIEADVL